jgi:acetolactate synthase-1/2/3 large subunit
VSFRRQDLFANVDRLYAGDMGLANPPRQMAVLQEADLLVVLGARLSDVTTQGYAFPRPVRPQMRLTHVHPESAVIGTHFAADLAIACDPQTLIEALGRPPAPPAGSRDAWIERLKAEQRCLAEARARPVDDGVPFEAVVDVVGRHLPEDAIVAVDAGAFGAPIYRLVPFAPPQRLLAPISGAMGFGVPAAVAAALREPRRPVICFVGDGGFLMTGNELAVALERKLPLKVILSENRTYASIRIQQEQAYPGRPSGTDLTNPDFELIARAFGFAVTRIAAPQELERLPGILELPGAQFVVVETSLQAVLP